MMKAETEACPQVPASIRASLRPGVPRPRPPVGVPERPCRRGVPLGPGDALCRLVPAGGAGDGDGRRPPLQLAGRLGVAGRRPGGRHRNAGGKPDSAP